MRAKTPLIGTLLLLTACHGPVLGASLRAGAGARAAAGQVPGEAPAVMVGAGDIAYQGPGAEQTARLLDQIPGTVFLLGDNAYQAGSPEEYARFFHPTWGRHLARIRPVPGNHEYRTPGAAGYFGYFGDRAGDPRKGYYAYDVSPAWHVVVINSATTGDAASRHLGSDSEQYRWVAQDLEANQGKHVIAMWHHPRFSTGIHGDNKETDALWRLLAAKGVKLALWGHDHHYERFAPMNADGKRDDARGVRSFVVGTGGKNLYPFLKLPKATTAVRNASTFGVLKLVLHVDGYEWQFVPVEGATFTDRGQASVR
ncbi:MAG: metallophosphoesterase [Candidatus Sericytochromatia bacterium]|nr:metallophosphoesterase [Candidatus Sericytochromatia bacterium]